MVPAGSYEFPPFPREYVEIPAGNSGKSLELQMIAVGSYGSLLLPCLPLGIYAGSHGCSYSPWIPVGSGCSRGSLWERHVEYKGYSKQLMGNYTITRFFG